MVLSFQRKTPARAGVWRVREDASSRGGAAGELTDQTPTLVRRGRGSRHRCAEEPHRHAVGMRVLPGGQQGLIGKPVWLGLAVRATPASHGAPAAAGLKRPSSRNAIKRARKRIGHRDRVPELLRPGPGSSMRKVRQVRLIRKKIKGHFVAATGATMTVRLGGVAVRASSAGESLLVLPVQYSHCWQIVSGSDATLFRADLMLLGISFSGDLQVELRQMFGPFWDSACRVADAGDAGRLEMADAPKGQ
jgi:hypothetical protein